MVVAPSLDQVLGVAETMEQALIEVVFSQLAV